MTKTAQNHRTRTKKRTNKTKSILLRLNVLDWIFLIFGIAVSIYVIFFYHENPPFYTLMSIIALLFGIIATLGSIKGYRWNFIIAFFQSFANFYTSWAKLFFGNALINLIFYAPATLVGFYSWGKHSDKNKEVIARKFTPVQIIIAIIVFVVTTGLFNIILVALGGSYTVMDSASAILAIYATILAVLRFREQWICWFVADILQVILWTTTNDPAVLALRIFFPISSIYGYINWRKLVKKSQS